MAADAVDEVERLLIERACERLVTDYAHLIDHGEAGRVHELFTEDGVWTGGAVRMKGSEELREGFGRRQAQAGRMSRHVCHTFRCRVVDRDHAEGVVYLTLYRHDAEPDRKTSPLEGPAMVGEYRDTFVRTPDGWRIAERHTIAAFVREGA